MNRQTETAANHDVRSFIEQCNKADYCNLIRYRNEVFHGREEGGNCCSTVRLTYMHQSVIRSTKGPIRARGRVGGWERRLSIT